MQVEKPKKRERLFVAFPAALAKRLKIHLIRKDKKLADWLEEKAREELAKR